MAADAYIHLHAEGVSLLLDVTGGRLPAVLHWGADLGSLDVEDAHALEANAVAPVGPNMPDVPMRVALLPEHRTGWVGRPGLSGSRGGRDWSPHFIVTSVLLDGEPATDLVDVGLGTVVVEASDAVAELGLQIVVELCAGGVIRSRATLTNAGTDGYGLNDLVLAYPVPEEGRQILDFAGRWSKERTPQRHELQVGQHVREGRRGRTGADAATVLHVGTPDFTFAAGRIWSVHTGWSGNHTHYAERVSTGEQVIGGGELLLPGEMILAAAQAYTTPWLYGSFGVGLDEVARRYHRFLRARPHHPNTTRPVTINVWEAVYFDHDLDRLVDLARRAAALGVERYVLDDGWFGSRRDDRSGLGDWVVSADVWPNGLGPLIDEVTALGMEFGLWFEPEMVNPDSDVARAHPEWIMATGDHWPVESRHQQVINLGVPACYAYIRDQMMAVLDRYDISYLKWDHNRDLIEAGTATDGGRPGVHAQTAAFYRLVDELKAAHPGLEIESCSSGGARVDLGVLERTDRIWVSDCIDPLDRQQMNRWTTQLVPPEMMGSHIASGRSHTTERMHDLSFRAVSAVFGHLGIEWDLAKATAAELAELSGWIAFYRTERELLLGGDLVRIDFPDASICAHGVVAPDRSRAIYSVAAVGRSEVSSVGRLPLPGLDPDRRYRVRPLASGSDGHVIAPAWWGAAVAVGAHADLYAGTVMPGRALLAGVRAPSLSPEHAVLLLVDAV
ncbi:MAG: alpha-galactosidase [Propionibacteriaceae bacterium]